MTVFADQSREQLRAAYREAWRKLRAGLPMQPLEAQIADVIAAHPEYQPQLQSDASLDPDFPPSDGAANPFLHMGLHLALREQLATDRPRGIVMIYRRLLGKVGSEHGAEHRMIEVLGTLLWEAQHSGSAGDEALYLERLQRL